MYIKPPSMNKITAGILIQLVLIILPVLFFADTLDAQPSGPQAARLIGTIQSGDFTGAVFSDPKGEQTFYRVSDTLPDGSKIVAVRSDSILLRGADGLSYDMYIAHDMTASPAVNTVVPVRTEAPVQPAASSAVQSSGTDRPQAQERPRGRHGRSRYDEE